jgi:hypothetical protein
MCRAGTDLHAQSTSLRSNRNHHETYIYIHHAHLLCMPCSSNRVTPMPGTATTKDEDGGPFSRDSNQYSFLDCWIPRTRLISLCGVWACGRSSKPDACRIHRKSRQSFGLRIHSLLVFFALMPRLRLPKVLSFYSKTNND